MMELALTVMKSIVSVVILFILARLMGKKQISQLSFFDYVVGISIGSIAASFAVDPRIDYLHGLTSMIVFAIFPIVLSMVSLKSYLGRQLLDGTPSILIQNGRILEKNLAKSKMNLNDLLEECRLKNAFDIAEVEYAILETSGKVSLLLKAPHHPVTVQDMNLTASKKEVCMNLILDGKILDQQLRISLKNELWLMAELQKQNIDSVQDVLLAYLDATETLKIHLKNNDSSTKLV